MLIRGGFDVCLGVLGIYVKEGVLDFTKVCVFVGNIR